jgi:hypothetical protein
MHPTHTLRAALLGGTLLLAGPLAAQEPTEIRVGQTVVGSLDSTDPRLPYIGHHDDYVFAGRGGQVVEVTMTPDGFDAFVGIGLRVNGKLEQFQGAGGEGAGSVATLRMTLPYTGTYVVQAASRGFNVGAYTLALTEDAAAFREMPTPPRPRTTPIRIGDTATGALTADDRRLPGHRSLYDLYELTSSSVQRVEIEMRSAAFNALFEVGQVIDGTFFMIDAPDDGGAGTDAKTTVTLHGPGTYWIRATSAREDGAGAYTLRLTPVP